NSRAISMGFLLISSRPSAIIGHRGAGSATPIGQARRHDNARVKSCASCTALANMAHQVVLARASPLAPGRSAADPGEWVPRRVWRGGRALEFLTSLAHLPETVSAAPRS